MRTRWLVAVAVVVLLGAGTVVAATDTQRSGERSNDIAGPSEPGVADSGATSSMAQPAESRAVGATGQPDTAAPSPLPSPSPSPLPERPGPTFDQKVVKTANLTVEVGEGKFDQTFQEATGIAALHGGFVANSSTTSSDNGSDKGERRALGSLELRVPSASFEAARRALANLGKVTDERISGQDVGGQLVDVEARLRSLNAEEDALRALMGRARTVGETVEVQRQLTSVREQIEQLLGQKARLDGAVQMSTIRATLSEPGAALNNEAPKESSTLARSFDRAVDGALAVLGGTLVVLGYALPLSAIILLGWLLYRLVVRRHRPAVSG